MTNEELSKLKKDIAELAEDDSKKRDLYLRGLANGEIQGPLIGYPRIDKPWLKYYPKSAIMSDMPKMKIIDYIYERNKNHLNQIALSYFGKNITYSEFFDNINKTAAAFESNGVKSGDVVTMAMATTPEMLYILYGLNKIGAIVNIIDPRLTSKEITEKVNAASSKFLIGLEMTVDNIIEDKEKNNLEKIVVVSPVESAPILIKLIGKIKEKKYDKDVIDWNKFILMGKDNKIVHEAVYQENQPAVIIYTGGTTGFPKGVVLTNDNLNAMAIMQVVSGYNLEREEKFLNFLPPFSAYSIVNASHIPLSLGFNVAQVPLFMPDDFPKLMRKYKPNHVMSGPILWDILMKDKLSKRINLSGLKSPISGGDSLPIEMEKDINKYLSDHKCEYKIQQGYGMTEVSAAAFYSTETSYKLGSVGIPLVKNNVSIRDIETLKELGFNQKGEIRICTPTMMKGYFDNEEATSAIIDVEEDGQRWISTGDIGYIDEDGHLYIVGRIKRMIVRSGNKIFPSTIENLIMSIPGIEHCSIVGMPDINEKSAPIAHIVLDENYTASEGDIIREIEKIIPSKMPDFNIPKKYVFRNNIPVTEMSKVDFKLLELESVDFAQNDEKIIDIRTLQEKILKK